jgi:hypothetical protein
MNNQDNSSTKMMQPTIEQVRAAYAQAGTNEDIKTLLRTLYGDAVEEPKDERPITERIKTFEDAYNALGADNPLCRAYDFMPCEEDSENDIIDVIAYYKLRIIVAALNEGWKPQFTEDEWRYYPYFYLYTQEEYDNFDEEQKAACVLFGGDASNGARCGFACALSTYAPSSANSVIGSRLCFKTSELAVYAGRQFTKIYFDYLMR